MGLVTSVSVLSILPSSGLPDPCSGGCMKSAAHVLESCILSEENFVVQPAFLTTTLLLARLNDSGDVEAWRLFDGRFRGVVVAAGVRLGLSEPDAEEAAQETLVQAVRDYQAGRYDRTKGRLSSWIVAIAHHRITDAKRSRRRVHEIDPEVLSEHRPEEDEVAEAFELAMERRIFEEAWTRLQAEGGSDPRTLQAFELTAMRGVPAKEAAAQTGLSVEQVYVAKNRVANRLRNMVEEIDRVFRDGW